MVLPIPKYSGFNYAQYLSWTDDKRWEIIEGDAFSMSPAPGTKHQSISGALFNTFYNFLKGKKCQIFAAPIVVRLADDDVLDEHTFNVVQPDLLVVCDRKKIDDKGIKGVPDLIVEILSESTRKRDLNVKLLLYQRFAVKEYWIADPDANTITVYLPDNTGKYFIDKEYTINETIKVGILTELEIVLKEIFAE